MRRVCRHKSVSIVGFELSCGLRAKCIPKRVHCKCVSIAGIVLRRSWRFKCTRKRVLYKFVSTVGIMLRRVWRFKCTPKRVLYKSVSTVGSDLSCVLRVPTNGYSSTNIWLTSTGLCSMLYIRDDVYIHSLAWNVGALRHPILHMIFMSTHALNFKSTILILI